MQRRVWLVLILVLISGLLPVAVAQETTPEATAIPKPAPTTVLSSEAGITLELYFSEIKQGGLGLAHVLGGDLSDVRARFFNQMVEFFPIDGDGFYGLLSVNMEQSPRDYPLSVFAAFADGRRASLDVQVKVVSGEFTRQDYAVPPDRAYLIDPQVEREEFAKLESVFSSPTLERLWDENGFALPVNSEFTSPFGAFRTLNETVQTRHTGWDLRATIGTPVMAMAAGKVAFAGLLEIRGNYVVIDHGYGLYSGYAHLSQIHVTRGQTISKAQIIGLSGNTGRSTGPHLHWEISVNDNWIDNVQFMNTWLP